MNVSAATPMVHREKASRQVVLGRALAIQGRFVAVLRETAFTK